MLARTTILLWIAIDLAVYFLVDFLLLCWIAAAQTNEVSDTTSFVFQTAITSDYDPRYLDAANDAIIVLSVMISGMRFLSLFPIPPPPWLHE